MTKRTMVKREQIHIQTFQVLTMIDVPARACCFLAASSCSGDLLYETGALEMVPGAVAFLGSRRFA